MRVYAIEEDTATSPANASFLDKQKAGEKEMGQSGRVDIPQEGFINALKIDR